VLRANFDWRPSIATAAFCTALALTSCGQKENSELQWARAALERNPQVKVIATDAEHNTVKLRIVATDQTITVTPGELAALPIADLVALTHAAKSTVPAPVETIPVPPTAIEQPEPPAEAPRAALTTTYTVKREGDRVHVSGPGVSIESTATAKPTATEAAPLRNDEPIICDGKRLLHLDGKRLNVQGDAVIARGGCELHITNSRILASGTAVTVFDATVHIANSELQGDEGSLTTSSAARVLLRGNRFTGLASRDPQSVIQDQGGNSWR